MPSRLELGRELGQSRLAPELGRECPGQEAGTQEQEQEQSRLVLERGLVQSRLELVQEQSRLERELVQSRLGLEQGSPVQGAGTRVLAGLELVHGIRERGQSRWELVQEPSRLEQVLGQSKLELELVRECPEQGAGTQAQAALERGQSTLELVLGQSTLEQELGQSRLEQELEQSRLELVLEQECPAQGAGTREQAAQGLVHGIRVREPSRWDLEQVPSSWDLEQVRQSRTRSMACRTSNRCLRPDSDARHQPTQRRLHTQPIRRISAKTKKKHQGKDYKTKSVE